MKRISLFSWVLLVCFNLSAQKQPVTAKLSDNNSFSMILLPDPQSYIKFDVNQPIFELMTAWTANNKENLNIKAVLCTGDLVEQNEWPVPDNVNGNQTSTQQWQSVSRSFERLDNKLPYIVCTGNHDYGYKSSENRFCQLSKYFPVERNNKWKDCLVSVGKNWEGLPTLENAAYELELDNWGNILVISLEFAPRDEAIQWAKDLVDSEKYKNHKVLLLTHSYMDEDANVYEKEGYKVSPANYGRTIWERLVYPSPNIKMLICGHAGDVGTFDRHVSYRIDKNQSGKNIPQMMFNAQTAGGGWHGNGGDGWLRILEFMPDGKTIKVKTFSPFFAISPTTAEHAWRKTDIDEFEMILE